MFVSQQIAAVMSAFFNIAARCDVHFIVVSCLIAHPVFYSFHYSKRMLEHEYKNMLKIGLLIWGWKLVITQ